PGGPTTPSPRRATRRRRTRATGPAPRSRRRCEGGPAEWVGSTVSWSSIHVHELVRRQKRLRVLLPPRQVLVIGGRGDERQAETDFALRRRPAIEAQERQLDPLGVVALRGGNRLGERLRVSHHKFAVQDEQLLQ